MTQESLAAFTRAMSAYDWRRGRAYGFQIWRAFEVELTNNAKPPNLKSVSLTPEFDKLELSAGQTDTGFNETDPTD